MASYSAMITSAEVIIAGGQIFRDIFLLLSLNFPRATFLFSTERYSNKTTAQACAVVMLLENLFPMES